LSIADSLEKAKAVGEILKDSPIPETVKGQAVLGIALGVDSETIVHGMAETLNQIETKKAERQNPQQPFQKDYTATEKRIAEMLTENTGAHILDSGGAYGRAWQRNRQIADFRKVSNPIVEIHAPHYFRDYEGKKRKAGAEISVYYDTFHYLNNFLELDAKAKQLQKRFEKYANEPDNQNIGWLALMEEFLEQLHEENEDSEVYPTTNTYNYDNILHGTLQYGIIELGETAYILLQIHGGCDVRGGYTKPQFFKLYDKDYFHMAQSDINVSCGCGKLNAYSDDCGYHWYSQEDGNEVNLLKLLKFEKNPDPKAYGKDKALCKKCGKPIEFSVCEDC